MATSSAERIAALGYEVVLVERDGGWVAEARFGSPGHAVGPRVQGATGEAATAGLADWLEWHRDHAATLEALQAAEGAYDRLTAERTFGLVETDEARRARREALARLEALGRHLAEVRHRQPRVMAAGTEEEDACRS
ncbi:MAG: hypothetical protein Q8L86_15235 [Vicinamibacterales bacterium]|nr:hypothetical protein [Vicinamibacterales bacterium]